MRTTITILFIALLAWMAGSTWYWVCKVKGHCEEVALVTGIGGDVPQADLSGSVGMPEIPPFTVSGEGQALMTFNNNLRFGKSGAMGVVPGTIGNALDSLAAYLKNNPNQDVQVTGFYADEETNETDFQNLGLARANFLKQQLVDRGLNADRVISSYMLNEGDDFFAMPDTLIGGIDIALLSRAVADGSTDASATARTVATRPANRNLYFAHNRSSLKMDKDLRDYLSGVIQYMNQHPDARIVLTGHTDSAGQVAANVALGRGRAETVRKYFRDFGLSVNRIKIDSKGEANPIASNDTDSGKQKNRRVEISIAE